MNHFLQLNIYNMNKHFVNLAILFLLSSFASPVQTIVGVWKRTGNILIMEDGTKKDMQKSLLKAMPCQAEIKYVFTAGGEQYSESPKGCGASDDMSHATYKLSGKILTLTPKKELGIPFNPVYNVEFNGDQLILSHEYTESERSALHSKAKKIIITYQKI
jgi:hypothetical protein